MFHLLAQAISPIVAASGGRFAGIAALVYLLAIIPIVVLLIVSYWKIYTKANQEGWKALVPFYNIWVMVQIVGRPDWWAIIIMLAAIPVVNLFAAIPAAVLMVIVTIDLAKSFGKSTAFGVLLLFIPLVGYPMLAFGKSKYIGPGGQNQQSGQPQGGPGIPPANPTMPPNANAVAPQQPQPPQPQSQQPSQPQQQPQPQPPQPQQQQQQPEPQQPQPQQPQPLQPNDTVQPTNQDEQQFPPSQSS